MTKLTAQEIRHFNLAGLLGGMTTQEFKAEYQERRYLLVRGAVPPDVVGRLANPSDLETMLWTQDLRAPDLDYVPGAKPIGAPRNHADRLDIPQIAKGVSEGAAIRVRSADLYCPNVAQACAYLADSLGQNVQGDVYYTPPRSYAHAPHYDQHDVWVVQCWGEKVWRLYDGNDRHVELPVPGSYIDPVEGGTMGDEHSFTMYPGDALYIPRGVIHHPHCLDVGSLHVTFGCTGITMYDFMAAYLDERYKSNSLLRRSLDPEALQKLLEDDEALDRFAAELNGEPDLGALRSVADMMTAQFVRRVCPDHRGMLERTMSGKAGAGSYEYEDTVVWRSVLPAESHDHRVYFPHDTFEMNDDYVAILTKLKADGGGRVDEMQNLYPAVDVQRVLSDLASTGVIRPARGENAQVT